MSEPVFDDPHVAYAPLLSAGKRRHGNRPKPDDTLPIFEDLPVLVWCPYVRPGHSDGHETAVENFGKNRTRPSGLQTYCKSCRKLRCAKDRKRSNRKNLVREMRRIGKRIERAIERGTARFSDYDAGYRDAMEGRAHRDQIVPHGNVTAAGKGLDESGGWQ